MRLKKIVAAVSATALLVSVFPIQALAYGETTDDSTLFTDTQGLSAYTTWYNDTWQNNEENNSGRIVLTPGKTEKDLNFAWYSQTTGTPAVKIATKPDMTDGVVYNGTATPITRSNLAGVNYTASNKVNISGVFNANVIYYYQYTDNISAATPVWSTTTQYKTKGTSSFQVLLVGDPQTGASGSSGQGTIDDINIAVDTYNWDKTTQQMTATAPDASFILSVGDQIDYSTDDTTAHAATRESEYAGFLYPALLRNLPLATAIGNHESKGTDYSLHYNNPNTGDNLGATASGSDYYFSYGDVLFIALNSNNRNSAEHEELMEKAIASHPDAKWKVVFFHHDIYGSGAPHSDVDAANLRIIFAPLMDEFDIDVCLTGHDHSYTRSYQLLDGTAIDYGNTQAVNPEGTLYITAGSASGSKFYDLETRQYYVAERSNTQLPTFSTIDFSENSLTIKTYDYNGNPYADDFTIVKNVDKESVIDLLDEINGLNASDYTSGTWTKLQNSVTAISNLLQLTESDPYIETLSNAYDKTLNTDNPADPLNYYGYASTASQRLDTGLSTLLDKTMGATGQITSANYEAAYSVLSESIENLAAVSDLNTLNANITSAQNLLNSAVEGNKKGQYQSGAKTALQTAIDSAKAVAQDADATGQQINEAISSLANAVTAFNAKKNASDVVSVISVKTGDTNNIALLIGLLSLSVLAAGGTVVFTRKKKALNNN